MITNKLKWTKLTPFPNPRVSPPCLLQFLHSVTPQKSPNTSTSLINKFSKFCYQNNLPNAIQSMLTMHQQGVFADCVTYSQLIKTCIARNSIENGKLVHSHVLSHAFYQPKTFLLNTFLNMYIKFDLLDDAQKLFDQMPDRNVVSWTTMISAFAKRNEFGHKAVQFLILMHRDCVMPNMFTYSSVLRACDGLNIVIQLHGCIVKCGLESDVFVRSALIDVYSKWGELKNAVCVFDEMVTRDVVVWNSIIGGLAQNSDNDEAMNFYKSMMRSSFVVDQSTLTSVLRACTGLALLELGRQVHVHVVKFKRDLILNNSLLDMYCKCGSLKDANSVFSRMVQKDVISWSTMISGLAQNGYSLEALKLFDRMNGSGIKPNYITMLGVLFACSHAGLLEDGWRYFQSMKKLYGIDPEREHYGCIIDLLGRAGKFDEAVKLMEQMDSEPDAVTWRTLLGACRIHRKVDLAIHAAKQILKLDPQDAGTYVLLSNIYANSQRWENVAEVRNMMKINGIKKEPGCSWVEVDRKIHAFILGDHSQPKMAEILRELNNLIQRLMVVGYNPDTNFALQDLEGEEQKEDSLRHHSEKLAIVFAMMSLSREKTTRIRKNIRICGDCHVFAKLVSKTEGRNIVIRDPIRYHHFDTGVCSCGDYW